MNLFNTAIGAVFGTILGLIAFQDANAATATAYLGSQIGLIIDFLQPSQR